MQLKVSGVRCQEEPVLNTEIYIIYLSPHSLHQPAPLL